MNATLDLRDRVVLITGCYGVLGGSMAGALAAAGARVAILGRRADNTRAMATQLEARGGRATAVQQRGSIINISSMASTQALTGRWWIQRLHRRLIECSH